MRRRLVAEAEAEAEEQDNWERNLTCDKICTMLIIIYAISSIYIAAYGYIKYKRQQEMIAEHVLSTVYRADWGSRKPRKHSRYLDLINKVIIFDTPTQTCGSVDECSAVVRDMQDYHMDLLHYGDIGYNFLVGGDGNMYEGRGWRVAEIEPLHYDRKTLGIAFIGNYSDVYPSLGQIAAALSLLRDGMKVGRIDKKYVLMGQKQCVPSESPGAYLYDFVREWEHWVPSCVQWRDVEDDD